MNVSDFQLGLVTRLQDAASKLSNDDRATVIKTAFGRYSKDRPLEIATDVNGNATNILPLPTDVNATFEANFSEISQIEFPTGSVPPSIMDPHAYQLYRQPAGLKLMLLETSPAASDTLRITWTARHKSDGTTIPAEDFEAVCDYAAALAFAALAAFYTQSGDSTLNADSVNYRTKGQEYLALAKEARARYYAAMGIPDGGAAAAAAGSEQGPAIAIGDVDLTQGSGVDRITHGRRR